MIKIEHSVFALPFALVGAFLAARGWPALGQVFWIVIAMVGARSAAMAFNRLADHAFDAANPRTAVRALPTGAVTRSFVWAFTAGATGIFVMAASQLNRLSLYFSPLALAIIFFYSYTKRFTSLSHLFLGLALACAPIGAWIAIRGTLSEIPLWLGLAVALWVGGFDIIYACQDVEFDRRSGLRSLPQRLGLPMALRISRLMHGIMVIVLSYVVYQSGLGWISFTGVAAVTGLLIYEHRLVRPADLSRVNAAFFTVNGVVSILFFILTAVDLLQ
ncbi:MAG: UbiA family prenyltransferase [Acidobacteria bacterium]|nr:UbiA family prenyltransferase [Acidobacteriota bacterium]MBI3656504.1 UbiA family prenyltransferase [Acidobacteriota bacterium]